MTGIGIRIPKKFDNASTEFEVRYYARSKTGMRTLNGDEGLEQINSYRHPAGELRPAWHAEVIKTRDVLLSELTTPDDALVAVLFDIRKGFHFAVRDELKRKWAETVP
ncbi:hypothetical protein CPY51_06395 [Rhizobium tubonense]|uniref:Uncharacterized protein n=1 Tax=Rhizobium tubonense TaxID=484088 RepID=A0A2W4CXB9_9HYPH|nr:hypothetical protein CPY51_06395 [Rhizobium tubonense]